MDIATLSGIILGLLCMVYPIARGGNMDSFVDFDSILITVGGCLASTLISYKIHEFASIVKVAVKAFTDKAVSPQDTIRLLVSLSQKARREGLLSLEAEYENIDDEYLKQSLQLVVDGIEPEIIMESMDLELENMRMRHERGQSLFRTMGALFPAWGMIGTLIGLIMLLKGLDNPSTIGPSMAIALVTTLYGSILANFVCIPIANKLALRSKDEIQQKKMIIEGILSIQAGENPRIMEHKLKTFLSPEQKLKYETDNSRSAEERIGQTEGSVVS